MWCGVAWCGVVWRGVVWCGVVWRGMVWHDADDESLKAVYSQQSQNKGTNFLPALCFSLLMMMTKKRKRKKKMTWWVVQGVVEDSWRDGGKRWSLMKRRRKMRMLL